VLDLLIFIINKHKEIARSTILRDNNFYYFFFGRWFTVWCCLNRTFRIGTCFCQQCTDSYPAGPRKKGLSRSQHGSSKHSTLESKHSIEGRYISQTCSAFYVVRATSTKIWSACRQYEIQYTERRMSSFTQNFMCYFFIHITCKKYMITIKEKFTKHETQNPGYIFVTFSTFLRN